MFEMKPLLKTNQDKTVKQDESKISSKESKQSGSWNYEYQEVERSDIEENLNPDEKSASALLQGRIQSKAHDNNNIENSIEDDYELKRTPEVKYSKLFLHTFFVLKFLVLTVATTCADIITDFITGIDHLQKGNPYWGGVTLATMFAPFIASSLQWIKLKLQGKKISVMFVLWKFPPFHMIRVVRSFFALLLMDTQLPSNFSVISKLQSEMVEMGLHEAFLEAAPQFILQLSIILRTGYINSTQIISIPISFISILLASARLYFLQRLGKYKNPNPPLANILITPLIMFQNGVFLFIWVFLSAYLKEYVLVCILFVMGMVYFILELIIFDFDNEVKKFDSLASGTDLSNIEKETQETFWTAIFTSCISPLTVWSNNKTKKRIMKIHGKKHKSEYFLLLSGWTVIICLLICLNISTYIDFLFYSDLDKAKDPPLTHCKRVDGDKGSNTTLYFCEDFFSCFDVCFITESCDRIFRKCSEGENSFDMMRNKVAPILSILLFINFFVTFCLQWLGDHENLFNCTSSCIHSSLLHDYLYDVFIAKIQILQPSKNEWNIPKTRSLLSALRKFKNLLKIGSIKQTLNMQDSLTGETCLHEAFRKGLYDELLSMIGEGAEIGTKNKNGESIIDWIIFPKQSTLESFHLTKKTYQNEIFFIDYIQENKNIKLLIKDSIQRNGKILWSLDTTNEDFMTHGSFWLMEACKVLEMSEKIGCNKHVLQHLSQIKNFAESKQSSYYDLTLKFKQLDIKTYNTMSIPKVALKQSVLHEAVKHCNFFKVLIFYCIGASMEANSEAGKNSFNTYIEILANDYKKNSIKENLAFHWLMMKLGAAEYATENNQKCGVLLTIKYVSEHCIFKKFPNIFCWKTLPTKSIERVFLFVATVRDCTLWNEQGIQDFVEFFLNNGCSAKTLNDKSENIFHIAALTGQFHWVELISKKLKVKMKNSCNLNIPIDEDLNTKNFELEEAVNSYNVNCQTPLHVALTSSNISGELIRLIFDCGADVTIPDKNRQTALHLAAVKGNLDFFESTSPNILTLNFNIQDGQMKTPLHYATERKKWDIVKYLLNKGKADPKILDCFFKSSQSYASESEKQEYFNIGPESSQQENHNKTINILEKLESKSVANDCNIRKTNSVTSILINDWKREGSESTPIEKLNISKTNEVNEIVLWFRSYQIGILWIIQSVFTILSGFELIMYTVQFGLAFQNPYFISIQTTIIFLPFLIELSLFCLQSVKEKIHNKYQPFNKSFFSVLCNLPIMVGVRMMKYSVAVLLLNFRYTSNNVLYYQIRQEYQNLKTREIIFRVIPATIYRIYYFLIGIQTVSTERLLVNFCSMVLALCQMQWLFSKQQLGHHPIFVTIGYTFISSIFFFSQSIGLLLSWIFVSIYLEKYFLFCILFYLCSIYLVYQFIFTSDSNNCTYDAVLSGVPAKISENESRDIYLTAIISSWLLPFSLWSNSKTCHEVKSKQGFKTRSKYFLLMTNLTTILTLFLSLLVVIFQLTYFTEKFDGTEFDAPIVHCFKMNHSSLKEQNHTDRIIYSFSELFPRNFEVWDFGQFSFHQIDVQQSRIKRVCESDENPSDFFFCPVLPFLLCLLALSFLSTLFIHQLLLGQNVSQCCISRLGYLIFDRYNQTWLKILDKLNENKNYIPTLYIKSLNTAIVLQDQDVYNGNSLLHHAFQKGFYKNVIEMLDSIKNPYHQNIFGESIFKLVDELKLSNQSEFKIKHKMWTGVTYYSEMMIKELDGEIIGLAAIKDYEDKVYWSMEIHNDADLVISNCLLKEAGFLVEMSKNIEQDKLLAQQLNGLRILTHHLRIHFHNLKIAVLEAKSPSPRSRCRFLDRSIMHDLLKNKKQICRNLYSFMCCLGANPNTKNGEGLTPVQEQIKDVLKYEKEKQTVWFLLLRGGAQFLETNKEKDESIKIIHKMMNKSKQLPLKGLYKLLLYSVEIIEDTKMIEYLMKTGCKPISEENEKESAIHIAAGKSSNTCLRLLLKTESKNGKTFEVSDVIDNENESLQTPLHIASERGNYECVKYLIRCGATIDAIDRNGKTPLHHAAENGKLPCLKELLKLADLNAVDFHLRTPLHYAAEGGHHSSLKALLEQKADFTKTDRDFKTPKELAKDEQCFLLFEDFEKKNQESGDLIQQLQEKVKNLESRMEMMMKLCPVNESQTICLGTINQQKEMKKGNMISKNSITRSTQVVSESQFVGVSWGTGSIRNSCTLDNFLTSLKLWRHTLEKQIGSSPVEQLLRDVLFLFSENSAIKVKELWVANFISENVSNSIDLYGTERGVTFAHIRGLQEIVLQAVCNCRTKKTLFIKDYLMPSDCQIEKYLQEFEQNLNLGVCLNCNERDLKPQSFGFKSDSPWLFFVDVESSSGLSGILRAPKTVNICSIEFSLAYISLQKKDHYTALFWLQKHWFHYDGMRENGKLVDVNNLPETMLDQNPVHVVYFRSSSMSPLHQLSGIQTS